MGKPYQTGLPDKKLQLKLQPYFSRDLAKLVKETENREQQCLDIYSRINADITKKTPKGQPPATLKPPLVESSLFASQVEAPEQFRITKSATSKNKKMIFLTVEYGDYDDNAKSMYHWKNMVILINEDNHWKIDNFTDFPENKAAIVGQYDVESSLKEFPSCTNDYKDYEKNNSYRH